MENTFSYKHCKVTLRGCLQGAAISQITVFQAKSEKGKQSAKGHYQLKTSSKITLTFKTLITEYLLKKKLNKCKTLQKVILNKKDISKFQKIFFYAAIGYKVANESKLKRHHYFICILFIKGSHLWIMVISCVALEYTNRQESWTIQTTKIMHG